MGKIIDYREAKRKIRIKKFKNKVSRKIKIRPSVVYSLIFILIVSFVFFSSRGKVSKENNMVEEEIDYVDMIRYARFKI